MNDVRRIGAWVRYKDEPLTIGKVADLSLIGDWVRVEWIVPPTTRGTGDWHRDNMKAFHLVPCTDWIGYLKLRNNS